MEQVKIFTVGAIKHATVTAVIAGEVNGWLERMGRTIEVIDRHLSSTSANAFFFITVMITYSKKE